MRSNWLPVGAVMGAIVAVTIGAAPSAGDPVSPDRATGRFTGGVVGSVPGGTSPGPTDSAVATGSPGGVDPYDFYVRSLHCSSGSTLPSIDAGRGCGARVSCGPGDAGTTYTNYGYVGNEPTALGTGCTVGAPTTAAAAAAPTITPGMILAAFRELPLPDSEVVVQPPGGETLVNFDTIFSTVAATESASVSLLGQTLEFDAFPSSYTWAHGDGSSQVTDWPGMEFEEGVSMDSYIRHQYDEAHVTVEPSVDTTWSARFRLNGGPWQPVAGTVTIDGDPSSLRVVEGQPNLVG